MGNNGSNQGGEGGVILKLVFGLALLALGIYLAMQAGAGLAR